MRKFTKSLLTLALLVLAMGSANSKTLSVNLSTLPATSENTTWAWNAGTSTGTFAWSGTSYNSTELFPLGNYSTYTTLKLETTAGTADHFRIIIKFTNGASQVTITPVATGKVSLNLTDYTTVENLSKVQTIRLSGANDCTGDVSVSSIYLEGPDINYIEEKTIQVTPTGTIDLNGITGTGDAWNIKYPITIADATLFGSFTIDSDAQSADIAAYDYLLFAVTEASADANTYLRVFVSTAQSGNNDTRVCLYPHPIADYASVSDWTAESTITAPGIYVVKISDYPLLRGIKNKAYWQGSAGSIKISLAYVGSGSPVVPVDKVVCAGEEALTDPSCVCFDVTALSGSGLTYNAANPNALFIAKAGQLTNTKNVIVDGVCANLELVDGKPFKAPSDFTATAAKFTKTVSAAGYATMVIPFAANLATGVKAYNLTGVSGSTITTTDAASIAANKPVLLEAAAGDYEFTATSAAIAATEETSSNGLLNGTYVGTKAAAGASNYVLQNGAAGLGFFLVTGTDATVKPFRASLNTGTSAPEFLAFDGNTTGIESVKGTEAKGEFFNLAGQRVAQPTKGLYIVNGKKVVLK